MAEVKKKKIISASEAGKSGVKKTVRSSKTADIEEAEDRVKRVSTKRPTGRKKSSKGLRTGAIILWVLAILFEVATIYMLNIAENTFAIIALVLDAICVIIGSLLWKKANRISPCRSESKFVCFIWNQMGVIAALLAFIPLGLFLLLKADKVSPKMKQVIAILAAALFVGSTAASVDYNPPTPESVAAAQAEASAVDPDFDGTVYWTRWGKSYHLDPDCQSLSRSPELISGTLDEAFDYKRNDPCDFCAGGADEK